MKVLFLDIDGVLNHDTTQERVRRKGFNGLCGIDGKLKERYLNWIAGKDLTVVLSSTWRHYPEMKDELREQGITWQSQTVSHFNVVERGSEVDQWLNAFLIHRDYAILDDNDWFYEHQRPYFVRTDPKVGLQDSDLEKLDRILEF